MEVQLFPESTGYYTNRLSLGARIDPINSQYGVTISNRFDEELFLPYHEIGSDLVYKVSYLTNFNDDYNFNAKIGIQMPRLPFIFGHYRPFLHRISLEFTQSELNSPLYFDKAIKLSGQSSIRFASIEAKIGIRELNGNQNLGFELGLRKYLWGQLIGASFGFYNDYWVYSAFLFRPITKSIFLRIQYDSIDNFDLLHLGFNYSFVKNRKDKNPGSHRLIKDSN